MTTASIEQNIAEAKTRLAPITEDITQPAPERLDAVIPVDRLLEAVSALIAEQWSYLTTITGLDNLETGQMEFLYHLSAGAVITTLRVSVPRENPVVPSVCGIIPSASFYERELIEMFGVTIENTPNTDKLYLPDDWPTGIYPLRKDYDPTQPQEAAAAQKEAAE